MQNREELELLCSRQLDGDLTAEEAARLQHALAQDPGLASFMRELTAAHEAMIAFARQAGPARVAVVHNMPGPGLSTWLAVAAAVVLAAAIVFAGMYLGEPQSLQQPPLADVPVTPAAPEVVIAAFSAGDVSVAGGEMRLQGQAVNARFKLPATVSAPADTHAVVRVGGQTSVLPAGASARFSEEGGEVSVEPINGDLYVESRGQSRTRAQQWPITLQRSGVTLRHTDAGYLAEPSFGNVKIGDSVVAYRQSALLGAELQISASTSRLDDWAIAGRVDAIKQELRGLLGEGYDSVVEDFWKYWGPVLHGVMARPAEAATSSLLLRFFEQHLWLPEWGEQGRSAVRNIAELVGEGTSDEDVPAEVRQRIARSEEFALKNPDFAREALRRSLEHGAQNGRKRE